MTKEDLVALKQKLGKLKEEEQILRDLHLKRLAIGDIQGPPVGYPSIDKPWLKYYRKTPIKDIEIDTMYNMVFTNQDMDSPAVTYLDKTWTYKKLKNEVDKCVDSFSKLGVKENDKVLMGVTNSHYTLVTILALNKIGAVAKLFDIRASVKDIETYANISDCKYSVVFDIPEILPKIKKVIDKTNLKKVIVLSPVESASLLMQKLYSLKVKKEGRVVQIPNDNRFIKFKEFIKMKPDYSNIKPIKYDPKRPTIMIQSSGTTGKAKTIVHSDKSLANSAIGFNYSDFPLGKNKKVLIALPPWIAYGLGNATLTSLILGSEVVLCENFDPDAIYKKIGKFTMAYAAPFHYRYLKNNIDLLSKNKLQSLRKIDCFVTGGDKITPEENQEFEEKFGVVVVNGYGNNEGFGALTFNSVNHNKYGSVGTAKYKDMIISYDVNNNKELPYGQNGEICSLCQTEFLGYEHNEEATKETIKVHDDGQKWLHTGDLGYIDSDGYVFLGGRSRRVITRLAFKISAYTIEDGITKNLEVKECVVVAVKDKEEEQVPMAYVILKDEFKHLSKEIENILFERCKETLKENEVPKYIRIVETLPYTANGKYDFLTLEQEGNKFVDEINENSKVKCKRL